MTRKQVFITRKIHTSALNRLQDDFDVEVWQEETPPPNEVLLDRISHVDGILSMLTDPISREVIANAGSHFQVISQMAVGFDNIDIDEATRRHIPVGHTPGVLTETCADFTWALLQYPRRAYRNVCRLYLGFTHGHFPQSRRSGSPGS